MDRNSRETVPVTVIYNCKSCRVGRRVEYTRIKGSINGHASRIDEAGKCIPSGVWIDRIGGGLPTVYGGDPLGICGGCGKAMSYGKLTSSLRPEVKCNATCQHARGFSCDCSCNGANHGTGWQVGAAGLFTTTIQSS
ncbi:hypothetical protein ACGLHS_31550 [Variovorax sp. VaC1]|uniref:hypothetical protein n=1 Tax=Variovorax sp. VaC1 TaxID=3373132 RepID=UPI00374A826C